VVDCLPDGYEVPLTSSTSQQDSYQWRQIEGQGWVVADYLRRTRGVVSGTDSCLNVRDVPSTLGLVLACLDDGTSVAILEGPIEDDLGEWLRIGPTASDEQGGWVLAGFLD
jgi:hypothetical protein